jgi:rare lipoprotein A (peptidoglycan hydrolase)
MKKWNHLQSDVVSNGTKLIVGYLKVLKDQPDQTPQVTPPKTVVTDNTVPPVLEKKKEKIKEEPKKVIEEVKKNTPVEPKDVQETVNKPAAGHTVDFKGGSFRNLYNEQARNKKAENESGVAAVFKTTSGWQDGKYYCFHNAAAPGTIIKITNSVNGKSVYAKVLDAIPDIKQNSGLLLRVSNAAAEELGAGENKFDCSITYYR